MLSRAVVRSSIGRHGETDGEVCGRGGYLACVTTCALCDKRRRLLPADTLWPERTVNQPQNRASQQSERVQDLCAVPKRIYPAFQDRDPSNTPPPHPARVSDDMICLRACVCVSSFARSRVRIFMHACLSPRKPSETYLLCKGDE